MGAPGYTEFCKNGHIVKEVMHHCIDFKEITECPWCGAREFKTIFEWLDKDYWGDEILVPEEPIGHEWFPVESDKFRGLQKVSVWDVSKVGDWRRKEE